MPIAPDRLPARRAGFTLIDLTITIVIIGIVAAIAVPRFSQSLDLIRADSAARFIAADLNYARHRAQISSQNNPVNFTTSPPGYAMPNTPHLNRSGATYAVNLSDNGLNVNLVLNLQGNTSVTYNSFGIPLVGSPLTAMTSGTITVSSGAASKTVTINPQTGRASVL
jgi:prepilin-type N-terminal cleavage/methylation domain-containing protein